MKVTLLTMIGACAIAFGASAQMQIDPQDAVAEKTSRLNGASGIDNVQRATPFWTEDFAGGFPATWTIDDSSGICPWTYTDDGSWGNFNGNNATGPGDPMTSTTAANGYLICDIDSANHFTYGQPSGSNYQYLSSYFQLDTIDCSAEPSVILSFEQFYRYNNGVAMNVQVSNDGTNWTTYDVSQGQANNAASANPVTIELNITPIAGNQPTVYIRFGWSARVYYWMIDDIALSGADANDVVLNEAWWGMGTFDYQLFRIPMSHAAPIKFSSSLTNNTGATLTGCAADVDVSGTSGSVYTGVTNALDLAPVQIDTAVSTTNWTPTTEDTYTVSYDATTTSGTDANPGNNSFSEDVFVTASLMGLDNIPDGLVNTIGISNFSSNTGNQFKIGNLLQVTNDDFVECLEIGITNTAQSDGQTIYGEVYAYNPTTTDFELRGYTDDYLITASDLGTVLSLPMLQAGDVYADEEILIVAGHYGGDVSGSDDVRFMYGQQVPEQMVYGFNGNGNLLYLTSPRAIVVRANFSCGLGLMDESSTSLSAFPNPFSDQLTVNWDASSSVSDLKFVDLNGRVVLTETVPAGLSQVTFNTSELASGIYTLRLNSETANSTLRVEVIR